MRAIAVFAIVFITLTGARRSGDGGCDDDDSSSTSTTGGGYSSGGGDDDIEDDIDIEENTDIPGTSVPGADTTPTDSNALADVRIANCDYDETSQEFTSDVTITNSSSTQTYRYRILIAVNEQEGGVTGDKLLSSDTVSLDSLAPGQSQTVPSESFRPLQETTTFECSISRASKYPVS
ncbi:hypothetical protein [Streptomyces sp. 184]|uniref:hypothetical protein n=1 Tax=Streptomyces sp. 184 TaxID=1827526 RepID=UPI003891A734